eukprot:CAMPEP_0201539698 /NCGR_PEP_ID=MMETSP0161_2-20130828/70546_1 /ASSEMBLY_ACC=CAM_ASM_000251 /TAXON_ID=180227 /ORGANISM="Neoparamoeba aestuarina, Strain SoJaBio B1-5/56/2" /LENGTH=112 /DNA_ID=CAMNT_0047947109 /DNA_START=23 /DNA_END=358 /DNA_ORIENTATION=+
MVTTYTTIFLSGRQGSGKTTLAESLVSKYNQQTKHFDGDIYSAGLNPVQVSSLNPQTAKENEVKDGLEWKWKSKEDIQQRAKQLTSYLLALQEKGGEGGLNEGEKEGGDEKW